MSVSQELILEALRGVPFASSGKDLVRLELIKKTHFGRGAVDVTLELPSPGYPGSAELVTRIETALLAIDGVDRVRVEKTWRVRASPTRKPPMPGIKNVIAVASGKGGVGKSTVASNLAVALAAADAALGLVDLDIYGPSGTVAFGEHTLPEIRGNNQLAPTEVHGVKFLSMGQLVEKDKPIVWRGPMIHKMVTQLLGAAWGELDYLILDLPPGTGDVQLTVVQGVPVAGAIVVTTPQEIALIDARKGLQMFRDNGIPILGIVENMASYICRKCGTKHAIFGEEGGKNLAEEEGVPLLARIPIDPEIVEGGDSGRPVALGASSAGDAFRTMAFEAAAALGQLSLARKPFPVLT